MKSLQKKQKKTHAETLSRKETLRCFSFALSWRLCAFACAFVFGSGLSGLGYCESIVEEGFSLKEVLGKMSTHPQLLYV
jgi:hypothetical protein